MTNRFHADGQGSPDSISGDLEAALATVTFPANKDRILDTAVQSGVSNEIITALNGIDERDYDSASTVLKQLG